MHLKRDTYEFPYLLVRDWTPNNAYENQTIYRLEYGLPHWLLVSDICFVIQSLSLYLHIFINFYSIFEVQNKNKVNILNLNSLIICSISKLHFKTKVLYYK
jgi:hypothetical protein